MAIAHKMTLAAACCALLLLAAPGGAAAAQAVPVVPAAAGATADAPLEEAVKQVLREHPEIVLDILRNNSEVVLEVAQQGNMMRKRKGMLAQWAQDATVPKRIDLAGAFTRGNATAPVTVVAYSDFTCGYCRQADMVLVQLQEKYGDSIRYVFKPLPKEEVELSLLAARYGVAAFMQDSNKGWAFYDALFGQAEALETGGEGFLKALAAQAGLDMKKLGQDLAGKKVSETLLGIRKEADELEIHGTPYFFINDLVIRGAVPKDLFEEGIEMALRLKK